MAVIDGISIRSVNSTQECREILEMFPRVFCFPKSRINENGGNITQNFSPIHVSPRLKHRDTCLHLCKVNLFANACRLTLHETAPGYFTCSIPTFPFVSPALML